MFSVKYSLTQYRTPPAQATNTRLIFSLYLNIILIEYYYTWILFQFTLVMLSEYYMDSLFNQWYVTRFHKFYGI